MKSKSFFLQTVFIVAFLMQSSFVLATVYGGSRTIGVNGEESFSVEDSYSYTVTGTWSKSGDAISIVTRSDRSCKIRGVREGKATLYWKGVVNATYNEWYWEINVVGSTGVYINATNFPDANFRNALINHPYGFGADGVLTSDEIKDFGILKVDNKGIKSLKGIEFFTALWQLSCNYNQLTVLDLSKNTKCSIVSCRCNQLTDINLKNVWLQELKCDSNKLSKLDVSDNTGLERLNCRDNELSELDLSKNKKLSSLICAGNKLVSLNVSNTQLSNLFLNNLPQFTTLIASNCSALNMIRCIDCQLTTVNVSNSMKLKNLQCWNNKIKGKAMDDLINSLPTNTSSTKYKFYVYSDEDNEGNVCTKEQVAAALAKGWQPLTRLGYQYSGSEPSLIQNIQINNEINASVYNLSGNKQVVPQKGINIIGGKKVVVK